MTELSEFQQFEKDSYDIAEQNLRVLARKHMDYGPKNIANAPGGPLNGLNVRLYDKLSRLTHLLEQGVDPQNESIRDTFLDIANYGLIGQMVIDGKWPGIEQNTHIQAVPSKLPSPEHIMDDDYPHGRALPG